MSTHSWTQTAWETIRYWLRILIAAGINWAEQKGIIHAAALAFFTVFSIAPVMIVAVTVAGTVLGESEVQGQLLGQVSAIVGPEAAEFVETAIQNSQLDSGGLLPTLIGIGIIIVGATTVFFQMQQSLNIIWGVVPKPSRNTVMIMLRQRLLSLTVVLVIGLLLLGSFLLSIFIQTVMTFADDRMPVPGMVLMWVDIVVSLAITSLLFATIFKILPAVKLRWKDVFLGGLITAGLFMLGQYALALYLTGTAIASTYGAAGSLVILLVWVHYSAIVLLYGAAFTRAMLEARGQPIRPRNSAARVWKQFMDEE